jgi:hypothetical protein
MRPDEPGKVIAEFEGHELERAARDDAALDSCP